MTLASGHKSYWRPHLKIISQIRFMVTHGGSGLVSKEMLPSAEPLACHNFA
ncbi:unnamed protein product [Ceratitis capitata]|uniref:(Mediterranean fruit fly) hypothetical protein n=1 Tax=Ceratitis capitata TaxID=7213 RepID=A0A811UWK1_CERCA|nr:unnamed protein product [Ceratitis capitata]